MTPDRKTAEAALSWAEEQNPGPWSAHSRYVAEACQNIASYCPGLSAERAYVLGLLHDIGRYAGVTCWTATATAWSGGGKRPLTSAFPTPS